MHDKELEQLKATNELLLEMVRNQKQALKQTITAFIATVICLTMIIIAGIFGFFWYESQFETVVTEEITTTTTTTTEYDQEVSGEGSNINNVQGEQINNYGVESGVDE